MIHANIAQNSSEPVSAPMLAPQAHADPVLALCAERQRQRSACEAAKSEKIGDIAFARMCAIDLELEKVRPTTIEGALSALELMRDQFVTFFANEKMLPGERLMIGLFESVQHILEKSYLDKQSTAFGTAAPTITDPVLDPVNALRAENAAIDALTGDIEEGFPLPAFDYLRDEALPPAATEVGAIEALRLAVEQQDGFMGDPVVSNLVQAALAYFETHAGDVVCIASPNSVRVDPTFALIAKRKEARATLGAAAVTPAAEYTRICRRECIATYNALSTAPITLPGLLAFVEFATALEDELLAEGHDGLGDWALGLASGGADDRPALAIFLSTLLRTVRSLYGTYGIEHGTELPHSDPMLEAIRDYRLESARNNATEGDVQADACGAFSVLSSKTPVPTSREGAIEALRLTIEEEIENCSDNFPIAMMTAVLGWLEASGSDLH